MCLAAKFVHDSRPVLILHRIDCTDADLGPVKCALLFAQKRHSVIQKLERRGHVFVKRLTVFGQLNRTLLFFEQGNAQFFFQFAQGQRKRGLSDGKDARGIVATFRFNQCFEVIQVIEIHKASPLAL